MRPYLKKKKTPSQKRAGGVAQGVGPEFKSQYRKKKKRKKSFSSEGGFLMPCACIFSDFVIICTSRPNKTSWPKQQTFISHSPTKIKVLAGLVSDL
jgi:hypothetical protein